MSYYRYHSLEGKKRNLPNLNPGKPTRTLPSLGEKLFFLLSYLKNYPLQQFQAATLPLTFAIRSRSFARGAPHNYRVRIPQRGYG